jgi:hypothetical protein
VASLQAYNSHGIRYYRIVESFRKEGKAAFDGSPRRLLAELAEVRCCRLIDMTGRKGRPRVRLQLEETGDELRMLAESLGAIPALR